MSWKITPLYFCSSNLVYFGQKQPPKRNFQTFEWLGKNSPNFSCHIWNHRSVFLQTLLHSSASWEIIHMYFFSWHFIWFGQKEPIKVQNIKLSTAHVKFYQLCFLIGSFCWKYIKFQLKRHRANTSHDTEEWCKIWRKTVLLFQKWQEFVEFWLEHLKVSKICTLICSFCATWIYQEWGEAFRMMISCGLENDMKNLENFQQSTRKSRNWDFDEILLTKRENVWA